MNETTTTTPTRASVLARAIAAPWLAPLGVLILAWCVRMYRVAYVSNFIDDRYMNVPSAFNYTLRGFLGPDNWWTQPAKHLFLYASLNVFGNDSVGWRMREVVFGSLAVLMVFLIARRLFADTFPALAAAILLALDPLSVAFSRASSEDVPAVFFMLAAVYFWLRASDDDRFTDWLLSGALLGVALALRIYVLLVMGILIAASVWMRRRQGTEQIASATAHLGVLPIAVYLLWWIPWMARGYGLGDLWQLHVDTYLVQASGVFPQFDPQILVLAGPVRWFTQWVGAGTSQILTDGSAAYTVMMNNPFVWIALVPAVLLLGWNAYSQRDMRRAVIVLSFIVLYGFFLLAPRDVLLYSALAVIPFGFVALGFVLERLPKPAGRVLLALAVVWSLYLLPLTMSLPLPTSMYGWLLTRLGLL